MARARGDSNASQTSSMGPLDQELGSMYDYLAKIILIGPSGSGKSCLLHRFVKNEWRVLTSQTLGVEFASKILRLGAPPHHTRIKLQLWDTAGTERFRSVSRSYYRGAAGAILVYDVTRRASFAALPTFLRDARALAGDGLVVLLAGNKLDAIDQQAEQEENQQDPSRAAADLLSGGGSADAPGNDGRQDEANHTDESVGAGTRQTQTLAPHGRAVAASDAARWASTQAIPTAVEVSALDGRGVDELFARLARTILTRIELGEIDPDDPASGIQYGDGGSRHDDGGGASMRSGRSGHSGGGVGGSDGGLLRWRGRRGRNTASGMLREWEGAWVAEADGRKRRAGCC